MRSWEPHAAPPASAARGPQSSEPEPEPKNNFMTSTFGSQQGSQEESKVPWDDSQDEFFAELYAQAFAEVLPALPGIQAVKVWVLPIGPMGPPQRQQLMQRLQGGARTQARRLQVDPPVAMPGDTQGAIVLPYVCRIYPMAEPSIQALGASVVSTLYVSQAMAVEDITVTVSLSHPQLAALQV
ncbi:hypothetical protein V8C86DRAFT_3090956 [Haematococcus lacustris]